MQKHHKPTPLSFCGMRKSWSLGTATGKKKKGQADFNLIGIYLMKNLQVKKISVAEIVVFGKT